MYNKSTTVAMMIVAVFISLLSGCRPPKVPPGPGPGDRSHFLNIQGVNPRPGNPNCGYTPLSAQVSVEVYYLNANVQLVKWGNTQFFDSPGSNFLIKIPATGDFSVVVTARSKDCSTCCDNCNRGGKPTFRHVGSLQSYTINPISVTFDEVECSPFDCCP